MNCPACGEEGIDITVNGDRERHFVCSVRHSWSSPLARPIPAVERQPVTVPVSCTCGDLPEACPIHWPPVPGW